MKIFVGTSGWAYPWNEGGNFAWYAQNSGLNSVELNASFYRFPYPNQVKGWAKRGKDFRWIIKVNRLVTHVYKFGGKALETWKRFRELFLPLDPYVDFYLFQMPPILTTASMERIGGFFSKTKLEGRFALEARRGEWFSGECVKWARELGLTFVSVDAPGLPNEIYKASDSVYLRMHGRTAWYSHNYSKGELGGVAKKILEKKPRRAYVMFNNDMDMLANAREMKKLLNKLLKKRA